MRHPHKVEKQNRGFSLVEVLVTLAIISILSIPIIQTFVNSAKTNKRAKNIQNATDVAQSVSEYFSAHTLNELKNTYKNWTSMENGTGVVFQNISDGNKNHTAQNGASYFQGNDNEKFYVSVVLDPNPEKTDPEIKPFLTNGYVKPSVNNLNENSSVLCREKMDQHDADIVTAFGKKYGITPDKAAIEKESNFRIYVNDSQDYTGKKEYRYYLDITYSYGGKTITYTDIELGIGVIDASLTKAPNLNIVYTPSLAKTGADTFAKDKIIINYRPDTEGPDSDGKEKPMSVYLIQQELSNANGEIIQIPSDNVTINCYSGYRGSTDVGSYKNDSENKKLSFYTNLTTWDKSAQLTTGDKELDKLYLISVYVWKDKTDGIKFDENGKIVIAEDYYTKVTNIKED